jgi:hypothetical protein
LTSQDAWRPAGKTCGFAGQYSTRQNVRSRFSLCQILLDLEVILLLVEEFEVIDS